MEYMKSKCKFCGHKKLLQRKNKLYCTLCKGNQKDDKHDKRLMRYK